MAYDPNTYKVNLDTPQPDGRKGESPRNAFTKYNNLVEKLKNVSGSAPTTTTVNNVPQWSTVNGDLKNGLSVTNSTRDATTGKLMRVGDFGLSYRAIDVSNEPAGDMYDGVSMFKWDSIVPTGAKPSYSFMMGIQVARSSASWCQLLMRGSSVTSGQRLFLITRDGDGIAPEEVEFISTANTNLVVDSGSNANGNWVQFADGTQICYIVDSSNIVTTNTAAGNIYHSPLVSLTYPKSFLSPPTISISAAYDSGWVWPGQISGATTSSFNSRIYGAGSSSSGYIRAIAIGRWK